MKYLILILSLFLVGCTDSHFQHFTNLSSMPKSKAIMVRLTTYSKTERRCDRWTKRGKSSTGIPLQEGLTAAVDPSIIPYFSKIEIPEIKLSLCALDTGGAVIKRTASRKNGLDHPIIDIYFNKESEAREFRLNNPQIVEAIIY